jgi:hypothetical protein
MYLSYAKKILELDKKYLSGKGLDALERKMKDD